MALLCKNLDTIGTKLSGSKPWLQVRTKKKLTLRSPQFPVYEKKLLLAACEPIMKRPSDLPTSMTCSNAILDEKAEPHPYIKILADEFKDNLEKSSFVVFYHLKPIDEITFRETKNDIIRTGLNGVEIYQNNVAELALTATKYEPLIKFYSRSVTTVVGFGDKMNIPALIKIEKRSPFLMLMFGIYQDRVLRKSELVEISNIPNLATLHAQLLHTLNSFGTSLTSTLDYHGKQLSSYLDAHSKSDGSNNC